MARVLVYTSPARGHLYPITPTLDELRRRGHHIALRTLSSQVETMRDRGFDAAPIAPAIEAIEHDDFRARTPQGALKRAVVLFAKRAGDESPTSSPRSPPRSRTCSWSTGRRGAGLRRPRRGAARGRPGCPTRCRFFHPRSRPSAPACPRRAGPPAGCATGP